MAGLAPQEAETVDAGGFIDPAEFLFTNTSYHDCFLTVTDPYTKTVENIGAVSSHLISQSSVFRKMFNKNNGFKHIEVNDVSPAIVKLMITYMYGGKVPPVDRLTKAQLALAARSYNLLYLEDQCCRVLIPTTVNDVFPALICVVHLRNAMLLPRVAKIIQEKTDEVIRHNDFLRLDPKCMDFIVTQESLAIEEVELWKAVVNWATTNAGNEANKTTRDVLRSALQYVRLATLTEQQIIDHVLPTDILTDTEIVRLLSAVSTETPFDCPGLSDNPNVRSAPASASLVKNELSRKKSVIREFAPNNNYSFQSEGSDTFSYFNIKPCKPVELESIVIRSNRKKTGNESSSYPVSYNVTVMQVDKGISSLIFTKSLGAQVVINGDIFLRCFVDNSNRTLALSEAYSYNMELSFTESHPVFSLIQTDRKLPSIKLDDFDVFFKGPFHVKSLGYRV